MVMDAMDAMHLLDGGVFGLTIRTRACVAVEV